MACLLRGFITTLGHWNFRFTSGGTSGEIFSLPKIFIVSNVPLWNVRGTPLIFSKITRNIVTTILVKWLLLTIYSIFKLIVDSVSAKIFFIISWRNTSRKKILFCLNFYQSRRITNPVTFDQIILFWGQNGNRTSEFSVLFVISV